MAGVASLCVTRCRNDDTMLVTTVSLHPLYLGTRLGNTDATLTAPWTDPCTACSKEKEVLWAVCWAMPPPGTAAIHENIASKFTNSDLVARAQASLWDRRVLDNQGYSSNIKRPVLAWILSSRWPSSIFIICHFMLEMKEKNDITLLTKWSV